MGLTEQVMNYTVVGDCWIHNNKPNKQTGYVRLCVRPNYISAHRASYELHKGPIPSNMLVRHTCDTRACVNPNHLLLGTHKDNTQDMFTRGRSGKPNTKYSDEEVADIRGFHQLGLSQKEISKMLNIPTTTVNEIVNFKKRIN